MKRSPERTCVGCRRRGRKEELVRLLAPQEGMLLVDVDQKLGGRGAYLCPGRECMKEALKKGRLSRALRKGVGEVTPDLLEEMIRDAHRERFFSLLHFCRKMRRLVMGREAVDKELRRGRVYLLLLARDLSSRSKRGFVSRGVPTVEVGTLKEYGDTFSTRPVGVLAVTEEGLARRLFFVAEKLRQLERGNGEHGQR
ncbi:MAG TPA: DUF448 domain-containing protein [Thermosulfidibacter takaii]|uniref:DUF448 domain-containing protein n=1 Tax=Thermosulfidibacter takaii TaxID=412593 RepID=A0A7C0U772_9BACT|nr:DUF448 domain-containing protein [Thermosulfidibacter takaii]